MAGGIPILVVEDDKFLRGLIKIILEDSRYEAFIVESMHSATHAMAGGRRFQLILCDLTLEDSPPSFTIQTMRKMACGVPIVAMTGWTDEETQVDVLGQGATGILLKGQSNWVKELEPFLDKVLGLGLAVAVPG